MEGMETTARERASLVDDLSVTLSQSGDAFAEVPERLKLVLMNNAWRDFETQLHEHVTYEENEFEKFVTTPPLRGLGSNLNLIARIVSGDIKVKTAFNKAVHAGQRHGGDRRSSGFQDITGHLESHYRLTQRDLNLMKLADKRPDLIQCIADHEVSEDAALMRAGLQSRTYEAILDSPRSAQTLVKKAAPEFLDELRRLL